MRECATCEMSLFPARFVLPRASSNWWRTGSLGVKGKDGSQPGLWSKGPVDEFYHPVAVSALSLARAGWTVFRYPGVIKNILHLIYTQLVKHDIVIGMQYNSRLLLRCYVFTARWGRAVPDTSLRFMLYFKHWVKPLEKWPCTPLVLHIEEGSTIRKGGLSV